jgi:hypothetical protein
MMYLLETDGGFIGRHDRDVFDDSLLDEVRWPLYMTAAAYLSGPLDDAEDDDLDDAVRHFLTLLDAGMVDGGDWDRAVGLVWPALLAA